MPVPAQDIQHATLFHKGLRTTFRGVVHPASSTIPDTSNGFGGVHQYRGIKYASVPARFRPSILFNSYEPVTDATTFGPICPQVRNRKGMEEVLFNLPEEDTPKQDFEQDEFECLNLNITRPADLPARMKVPVMVWVHGGGDRGTGSSWVYDPGAFVAKSVTDEKPVIVVTFNYRLGLFGFAASPQLQHDPEHGVGNFGLRDQRRALEWVHKYISDFGGDPKQVTLFGQSKGAADVVYHLLSSANAHRPLFGRAIIQSAVLDTDLPDVSTAGRQLARVAAALGLPNESELRTVEAERLIPYGQTMRAVDDGVWFRQGWKQVFVPHAAHHHHHWEHAHTPAPPARTKLRMTPIRHGQLTPRHTPGLEHELPLIFQPVIIGDCGADSLLWSLPVSHWTAPAIVRRLKAICQSLTKANQLLNAYDLLSAASPSPAWSTCSAYGDGDEDEEDEVVARALELVNDARIAWPTECIARAAQTSQGGAGAWRYVFDQEGVVRNVPHHAADLLYLFDNARDVIRPERPTSPSSAGDLDFPDHFDVDDDEEMPVSPVSSTRSGNSGFGFGMSSLVMSKCSVSISISGSAEGSDATDSSSASWAAASSLGASQTQIVDSWTYARIRDAIQSRWIAFAYGEAPWTEERVFVFGPEGETGERSSAVLDGRRRPRAGPWKDALASLGMTTTQKVGVELSRGPPLGYRVH